MLITTTINELAIKRGEDSRTVTLWCLNNGVKIYPKEKGRNRFVYTVEYDAAYHKDLLPKLIEEYGDKASDALEYYLNEDSIGLRILKEGMKNKSFTNMRLLPQNSREKELMAEYNKRKAS